jgi:hypothetical protein
MSDANPETPSSAPAAAEASLQAATSAPVSPAPTAQNASQSATASAGSVPATPTPAAAAAVAEPETPAAPKIKPKKPTQRACDEKDAKGKLCCGHLKRWYDYPKDIEALIGVKVEIYRCEFCKTLYKPSFSQPPHSYTIRY